ncbi:MAG TPA: RNA 3'-terminal phosphate cyclase [Kofleriaceae bacterium]|jgi:RNA 3'-terminal phosphate cyclase (ATP)
MREGLVEIDGTRGEGGGQLLRGALALAAATGRGFHITQIRRTRSRPGLMRQHLTAVTAAAAICDANVVGAELGSTDLTFEPGAVRAGEHAFAIGTAGSCILVLQAIVPALARLGAPSRIRVSGGTHNPLAPPFEFLRDALAPQLAAIGWNVEYQLARHGFFPAGGGEVVASIAPATEAKPLVLVERGERLSHGARIVHAHLATQIALRELATLTTKLNWERDPRALDVIEDSLSPGNVVLATARYANVTEVASAIGEREKTAEHVATRCAEAMRRYLRATAPVGEHLLDQLLVPLALGAGGRLRAIRWTPHAEAQRELLLAWFGRDLSIARGDDGVVVDVPAMS